MLRFILFMFIMASVNITYALQIKSISDNKSVLIKISAKEQSRIFVYNDRISVVRGLDGAYDLKKDDKLGDIYIQPSPYFQHKAFNIFITTEQGHTYNLLATPLDIPSESIELKPLSPSHLLASRWERNSPYQQTIINLISAMTNETNPDGYAVINLGKVKPQRLSNCITMRLLTIYKGDKLQGEIWLLKNEGKSFISLRPRNFYQDNVLGASINNEGLNPGENTLFYRVVGYDE